MASKIRGMPGYSQTRNALWTTFNENYIGRAASPYSEAENSDYQNFNKNIEDISIQMNRHFDNGFKLVDDAVATAGFISEVKKASSEAKKEADRISSASNKLAKATEVVNKLTDVVSKFGSLIA